MIALPNLKTGSFQKVGGAFLIAIALGIVAPSICAQEESDPETGKEPAKASEPAVGDVGIMLVSKVSSPKVYAPIDGAQQTVMSPAYIDKYSVRLFTKEKWKEDGLEWDSFYDGAVEKADALVDELKPTFRRDARGVLDYAEIEHESPWLSSVLVSRRFFPRFEREFGERLHVVVVGRHRLFVFPADGGRLDSYAPALADLYHDESILRHPVSLEIFLVEKGKFRVIGSIED